jgi:O-antigen/teichoic acid export membrane protein
MSSLTIITKVFQTRTFKDSAVSITGNIVGAGLNLISLSLLARFLTQADFGIVASFRNFSLLVGGLLNFGFSQWLVAHIKQKDRQLQAEKTSQILSLSLIVSLGALFCLLLLLPLRTRLIGTASLPIYFLSLIAIITFPLNQISLAVLEANLAFVAKSLIVASFYLLKLILIIFTLKFFGLNSLSAVIIGVFSFIMVTWLLFRRLRLPLRLVKPQLEKIKQIFKFSSWLGFNQIIINIYGRLNVLLLTFSQSAQIVAVYGAADQLIGLLPILVGSISTVIAPRFSRFKTQSQAQIYGLKVFLLSLGLSLLFLAIALLAKPIILLSLSDKYKNSILIFQILSLANIPLALSIASVNKIIYFYKQTAPIFFFSLIQLVILSFANLLLLSKLGYLAPAVSLLLANSAGLILPVTYLWLKKN